MYDKMILLQDFMTMEEKMKIFCLKFILCFFVIISLLIFTACNLNPDDGLSKGWNDEPIVYLFSIKETTLPYLHLTETQKEIIENNIAKDDMFIIKMELQKIIDTLANSYPSDQDNTNNRNIKEKIDNTISWLNDIILLNNINAIRENYFTRYRYEVNALVEYNWYWIKGQKRKFENLITRGNKYEFENGVKDIIKELEKDKIYYKRQNNPSGTSIYHSICSTIDDLNYLLAIEIKTIREKRCIKVEG